LGNKYLCRKLKSLIERFKVRFLEEAVEFLESLEEKPREKVYYNIRKAQVTNVKGYSRS